MLNFPSKAIWASRRVSRVSLSIISWFTVRDSWVSGRSRSVPVTSITIVGRVSSVVPTLAM